MLGRFRQIMDGPASAALVLIMLAGCLVLWVGLPLGWLWIGSQVQASASLGTALMVTMLGIMVSVVAVVVVLGWLNRRHLALQERRNRPLGRSSALEVIVVSSGGMAVLLFAIWFFLFAGASPVPLNIGF